MSKPKLFFPNDPYGNQGIMASSIANYMNAEYTRIVRELVQNALDAVRETGRNNTIVQFELGKLKKVDIPEIEKYEHSFNCMITSQKELNKEIPDQHKGVIDSIETQLKSSNMDVLYILDNGVGLDKKHMLTLMRDGGSGKGKGTSGSFGVGHLTAIPASNLRYVFYGGVSKKDKSIAAGHCILATFQDGKSIKNGKGFFVKGHKEDLVEPWEFVQDKQIPGLIKEKLDWIKEGGFESKTGSVVVIPAFNFFKEDQKDNLWQLIKQAVATNFFAAISQGELSVQFNSTTNPKECQYLNADNIKTILEGLKGETRSKFLNGQQAYAAYETICSGSELTIKTKDGNVNVRLRKTGCKNSKRVHLCRNGMWITNSPPQLQPNQFSEYECFNAVILLDKQDCTHDLVRNAEGPEHKGVDLKNLDAVKKAILKDTFKSIQEGIKSNLNKFTEENFFSNTFKFRGNLDGLGDGDVIQSFGEWRKVTSKVPSPSHIGTNKGKGTGSSKNPGKGSSASSIHSRSLLSFQAIPIMKSARHCVVEIVPQADIDKGEIRFTLDGSYDETWAISSEEPYVRLRNVTLNGKSIVEEDLVLDDDGKILGIFLKNLQSSNRQTLDFKFEIPSSFLILDKHQIVAIKAQIYESIETKAEVKDG